MFSKYPKQTRDLIQTGKIQIWEMLVNKSFRQMYVCIIIRPGMTRRVKSMTSHKKKVVKMFSECLKLKRNMEENKER